MNTGPKEPRRGRNGGRDTEGFGVPLAQRLAWSVKELAELTSLSRTTLYALMGQSVLRYYKAFSRRYVTAEAWSECCKRLEQQKESK